MTAPLAVLFMLAQLKLNMTRQMVRIPTRVLLITGPPYGSPAADAATSTF
jgi:hypothetical protein